MKKRLIEFFAGTKSISRVAESEGWETFTTDVNKRFKTDYTTNILAFDSKRIPWIPDAAWLSPPCTCFSIASMWKHWTRDHEPKTVHAVAAVKIVERSLSIVGELKKANPQLLVYFENPRGMMSMLKLIPEEYQEHLVTYCSWSPLESKFCVPKPNNMEKMLNPEQTKF